MYVYIHTYGAFSLVALSRTCPFHSQLDSQPQDPTADISAMRHSRHVCCGPHRTCLLRHAADVSAVAHNKQVVFWVTQQTCLCDTGDMSGVRRGRYACCVTQQACLL